MKFFRPAHHSLSLHWVPDMVFRDDQRRLRTNRGRAGLWSFKRMAQNLVRQGPGKAALRQKRMAAGWDDDLLASLIIR